MYHTEDFAMKDITKDYCIYCARPDGSMQSFEEKRSALIQFVIHTQGFHPVAAEAIAENMMKKLPAWADYFPQTQKEQTI